jgi:hypothetical protein
LGNGIQALALRYCAPICKAPLTIRNPLVDKITSLDKFRVPIGNQEIELQQIEFAAGGVPLLRLRIREHRRFTIFDIDAVTAGHWAEVMENWSKQQLEQA